jgi:hypothetical protein
VTHPSDSTDEREILFAVIAILLSWVVTSTAVVACDEPDYERDLRVEARP